MIGIHSPQRWAVTTKHGVIRKKRREEMHINKLISKGQRIKKIQVKKLRIYLCEKRTC